MKTILHSLRIHAAPDQVHRALTTREGLTGWWSTEVSLEHRPGGLIRFRFAGDFNPVMRQDDVGAGRIAWTCVDGHANWANNTFGFALEPRGAETQLHFVQEYAQELSNEVYGTYNFNWGYYLNSLKRYCETGEGTPFQPPQRI